MAKVKYAIIFHVIKSVLMQVLVSNLAKECTIQIYENWLKSSIHKNEYESL